MGFLTNYNKCLRQSRPCSNETRWSTVLNSIAPIRDCIPPMSETSRAACDIGINRMTTKEKLQRRQNQLRDAENQQRNLKGSHSSAKYWKSYNNLLCKVVYYIKRIESLEERISARAKCARGGCSRILTKKQLKDGSKYCRCHSCEASGCETEKSSSFHFCEAHTCQRSTDCRRPQEPRGRYCDEHTCPGCNEDKSSNSTSCGQCRRKREQYKRQEQEPMGGKAGAAAAARKRREISKNLKAGGEVTLRKSVDGISTNQGGRIGHISNGKAIVEFEHKRGRVNIHVKR